MARDPYEARGQAAFLQPDDRQHFRFDRIVTSVQDMFVKALEAVLVRSETNALTRSEMPLVRKFASAPASGEDTFETYTRLTQEWPDIAERLPTVAVLKPTGLLQKAAIGLNLIGVVQDPPRVETVVGPFNLAIPIREVRTVTITQDPLVVGAVLSITIYGRTAEVTVEASHNYSTLAEALAREVTVAVGHIIQVSAEDGVITLTRWEGGVPFAISVSAGLTAALVVAGTGGSEAPVLVLRTTPKIPGYPVEVKESRLEFRQSLLNEGENPANLPATSLARMINQLASYVQAVPFLVGADTAVRLEAGGPEGGGSSPAEIEVSFGTTESLAATLGLAIFGNVGTFEASVDGFAVIRVGAGFTSALVGRYVTIADATSEDNDGRFPILSVPNGDTLIVDHPAGIPEGGGSATYFIGARDDWTNPLRPPRLRFAYRGELSIPIAIVAESPEVRSELESLIAAAVVHQQQESLWEMLGPGFVSEDGERDRLSLVQVISRGRAQLGGGTASPRGGSDASAQVHTTRIDIPISIWAYVDREATDEGGRSMAIVPDTMGLEDFIPRN